MDGPQGGSTNCAGQGRTGGGEQPLQKKTESQRRAPVQDYISKVVSRGEKAPDCVVDRICHTLQGTVEIGRCGIKKQEMPESLRKQPPASDQRVPQHQRRVVPDELPLQRGRIGHHRRKKREEQPELWDAPFTH